MLNKEKIMIDQKKAALLPQVTAAATAAMVQLGLGAVNGFSGATIPRLTNPDSQDLTLNTHQVALFASLVSLGATAGCIISSVAIVRLGPRKFILWFLPAKLLSWLLMLFTQSVELLLVARFLLGFFAGAMAAAAWSYVIDISYKDHRGGLASIVDIFRQCGMLLVYILGSLTMTWRMMTLICACLSTIIPFIFFFFLPDSPRFLVLKKEIDLARNSLKKFRGTNFDIEPEIDEIIQQLNTTDSKGTIADNFHQLMKLENFKKFILLALLIFVAQFTGNFVVINYTVPIFQASNTGIDSYTSSIIIGVIRVTGTCVYLFVIDRLGRKVVFIVSFLILAMSGIIFGIYFFLKSQNSDIISNIGWLPLTCLVVFSFFSCIGHPVLTILLSELLPTSFRSLGFNLLVSMLFFGAFSVSQTYPTFVSLLGVHGTFWLYSCCSVLLSIVFLLFVPETKNKSLEAIQNKG